MNIEWNKLCIDEEYIKLKKEKDFLYDMIIGELNRISVSDDFNEKNDLFLFLINNIKTYYKTCIKCTKIMLKYNRGDKHELL